MKKSIVKNILSVSVVAAMVISVVACSDTVGETNSESDETMIDTVVETETEARNETVEDSIDDSLVGVWTYEDSEASRVYTFNDDGTGDLTITSGDNEISWEFIDALQADENILNLIREGRLAQLYAHLPQGMAERLRRRPHPPTGRPL